MLGSQQHPYGLTGFGGSIGAKVSFVYFPLPVKHSEWLAMEVMEELCPGCPEWKIPAGAFPTGGGGGRFVAAI